MFKERGVGTHAGVGGEKRDERDTGDETRRDEDDVMVVALDATKVSPQRSEARR